MVISIMGYKKQRGEAEVSMPTETLPAWAMAHSVQCATPWDSQPQSDVALSTFDTVHRVVMGKRCFMDHIIGGAATCCQSQTRLNQCKDFALHSRIK